MVEIAVLIALYFLPTLVATMRGHRSAGSILALNLLLGWTFIGWAIAFVWSFSGNTNAAAREDAIDAARYAAWAAQVAAYEQAQRQAAAAGALRPRS
jgi:hypothetical protein